MGSLDHGPHGATGTVAHLRLSLTNTDLCTCQIGLFRYLSLVDECYAVVPLPPCQTHELK